MNVKQQQSREDKDERSGEVIQAKKKTRRRRKSGYTKAPFTISERAHITGPEETGCREWKGERCCEGGVSLHAIGGVEVGVEGCGGEGGTLVRAMQ